MEYFRAIGYCMNPVCETYCKGVFLIGQSIYYCGTCRCYGKVEVEQGLYEGEFEKFSKVKVMYNYEPIFSTYKSTAIVSTQREGNVYTLKSPLIKTEVRALKVAETLLANLNLKLVTPEGVPLVKEMTLSFDDNIDKFKEDLRGIQKRWSNL